MLVGCKIFSLEMEASCIQVGSVQHVENFSVKNRVEEMFCGAGTWLVLVYTLRKCSRIVTSSLASERLDKRGLLPVATPLFVEQRTNEQSARVTMKPHITDYFDRSLLALAVLPPPLAVEGPERRKIA